MIICSASAAVIIRIPYLHDYKASDFLCSCPFHEVLILNLTVLLPKMQLQIFQFGQMWKLAWA